MAMGVLDTRWHRNVTTFLSTQSHGGNINGGSALHSAMRPGLHNSHISMATPFENATSCLCIDIPNSDGAWLTLNRLRRDGTKAKTMLVSRRSSLASGSKGH